MQKRPLCLIAVLLLMILWILPEDVWLKTPDIPSGELVMITGTVNKREQKEEQQAYYIKNCQCVLTDSKFSVLAFTPKGVSYPVGCEISLYGTIYQLNKADNPGQFDGASFYQSQGILYTFQVKTVVDAQGRNPIKENLTKLREYLGERMMELYSVRDGGILKAVLLGDKSSLREEDQLLYQKNGISHLLAISGLHISMIGVSLYHLLRKCHLTFWEAGIPSGVFMVFYGIMTGFGISTIRAICMFLVMLVGDVLGKAYDMASAMALAAIVILIRNPLQAKQAGFLLSFGAVLGICFVCPILQSVFEVKQKYMQTILFSLSISLMTYPLSVHFFYEYSLYSIFLNFIVIPLMPVVLLFGGAGTVAGCFWEKAGNLLGRPMHWVLSFYEVLGEWIVELPAAVIRQGSEETWQLVVYYAILVMILLFLWYRRKKEYALFLVIALLIVTIRFHPKLQLTVLDLGQGDGIFLRLPQGTTCFIDGGSMSVKNVGKYRILPYLKYEGIQKLDYLVFSHLDEDHISGIRELLEMSDSLEGIEIDTMLFPDIANPDELYKEMWHLAEKCGVKVVKIGAGDKIYGENWEIVCMYPIKGCFCEDKNNVSTVLRLQYEEFSALFTGDLGFEGERKLLDAGVLQDVDVWKVSHHGSKYSGSTSFLECIQPNVSLISVGRNNYGHPNEELLERISRTGSSVWATIDTGAVMLECDGEKYEIFFARESDIGRCDIEKQ